MNASRSPNDRVHVAVFGRTDPGRRREENQDNLLVADLSRSTADGGYILQPDATPDAEVGRFDLGTQGAILLVADGMGGAAAGGVASKLAVSWIYREMLTGWANREGHKVGEGEVRSFVENLRRAVGVANARIHDESNGDPRLRGMGTTTTLAGILGPQVYLAQVGDSRGYLVRNGSAVQLTRDQSFVQELIDAGALTQEAAERSEYRNRILQAVGGSPEVDVALTYHPLRRGDVILLCSDGLSGVVTKEEIADLAGGNADLSESCEKLIELANSRGGPDNITVIMARLDGDGLAEAAPGEAVAPRTYELG